MALTPVRLLIDCTLSPGLTRTVGENAGFTSGSPYCSMSGVVFTGRLATISLPRGVSTAPPAMLGANRPGFVLVVRNVGRAPGATCDA